MRCRTARIMMTQQLREELPPEQAAAMTRHLAGCPACRAEQEALHRLSTRLLERRSAPTPAHRPTAAAGWTARYLQAHPRPGPARWPLPVPPRLIPLGITLAAGFIVAACAVRWDPRGSQGRASDRVAQSGVLVPREWRAGRSEEVVAGPAHTMTTLRAVPPPLPRQSEGEPKQVTGSNSPSPRFGRGGGGEGRRGDLEYLNGDAVLDMRRWVRLTPAEWEQLESRCQQIRVRDDFVTISFPRVAAASDRQVVAATEAYKREAAIVDARLAREVTLQFKGMALSDLCERLRADTGIHLVAGNSVADEKVTIFCQKQPLRDIMRQLSRPFGYTWLRSGKPGEYRYELVQDLKSQLLEEELRNRDRHQALLALEREIERYRPYLMLSPDEALAKVKTAPAAEKLLLEKLAGGGWGPIQMYFRLSPRDLLLLRSGHKLTFGLEGELAERLPGLIEGAGARPLPEELRRGVLQSLRDRHVVFRDSRYWIAGGDDPGGVSLAAVPEARPMATLDLHQSELGQFTLNGDSGFAILNNDAVGSLTMGIADQGPYASGWSPTVLQPKNREVNAKLAGDPTLRALVSIAPGAKYPPTSRVPADARRQSGSATGAGTTGASRVTTADVLEAIHQATGRPVIGDFYTRLYRPESVSVRNVPLFDALNQLTDAMHLRWSKEGNWQQFRSSSYYNDRLKEVPNRLLARWAASRRQHGVLTLNDLLEIVQLTDTQLDATEMAEGAREWWGLAEWGLPRGGFQRPHLRYLAQLTPAQREEAIRPAGLAFNRMSLAQHQLFIAMVSRMSMGPSMTSLEELAAANLRLAYTRPGEFQVQVPAAPGGRERGPIELALVREPTREAALQAAHRLNPGVEPGEIVPTELPGVTIIYTLGSPHSKTRSIFVRATPGGSMGW